MKKLALLFSSVILLAVACDKVKTPRQTDPHNTGGGKVVVTDTTNKNLITKDNKAVSNSYKVLLEDYTGHTCGNCPKAGFKSDSLAVTHNTNLVVMAVHAGNYATVENDYPDYYGTPAGEAWFQNPTTGFGFFSAGNPNGMVNRKVYPGNPLIEAFTKWSSTVTYALANDPFTVKLDVTTYYDPTVLSMNVEVLGTFKTSYANDVKISVALLEDSIIGPQKDYRKFPDLVPQYVFNHMLRATFKDSPWGDNLKTGPSAVGDTTRVKFNGFPIKSSYNDKNLTVVVYAYDAQTLEVLQAEKVKIR